MSETLYRKYRPHTFKDVLGQEAVVSALETSISKDSLAHAYIFAGSRGTGKTSIARIFAKALETSEDDIYEIDAASNRGIDDIRAIRDAVHTLPFRSKYKIYIIDEAHMLTKDAWNALLKTLEEPPKHVIFIMATTELEKIPETILSRCETFAFRKPTEKILKEVIEKTAEKEGFKIESEAAEIIALLADGSFRDSHGILQKIASSSQTKKITLADVEKISGAPKIGLLIDFLDNFGKGDTKETLKALSTLEEQSSDVKMFGKLLLERMRQVILLRIDAGYAEKLKDLYTKEHLDFLLNLSKTSKTINSEAVREFLHATGEIGMSFVQILPLELAVIKLLEEKGK
jgi:DNA polymerase-3 subunit gamma/tau